jgi:ferredoxin-nitrite reductase
VARVRACTGSAVCALGITAAPEAGRALVESAALGRNSALRVHVSGCPNSCAQHQAGDIGLAGGKVRVAGRTRTGYQLYLGASLCGAEPVVGEVIGRVADTDVGAAIDALVGAWEALRHPAEPIGATARRVGLDAIAAHVESALTERWATGPEPEAAVGDATGTRDTAAAPPAPPAS